MDKAVVLLSGGLDSAVAMWLMKQRRFKLYTLSISYYRRNPREIDAARKLSEHAEAIEHKDVPIEFMRDMEDLDIPNDNSAKPILDSHPKAYLPGRNLILYSLAAHWAERVGATRIIGGHNRDDRSIYNDARPEFFARVTDTIRAGSKAATELKIQIELPLALLNKSEIVRRGSELGVPFDLTWSCYGVGERHCALCDACVARRNAFSTLNLSDPVEYAPTLQR